MNSQIVLHCFEHHDEEPSSSGYCQKMETYLRFAKISYRTQVSNPFKSPTRELPFIEYEGKIQTDTQLIIRWMAEQKEFGESTIDERCALTPLETAETTAYRLLVEQGLYPAMLRYRWMNKDNRNAFVDQYLYKIPWLVRIFVLPYIISHTRSALYHKSIGKFTDEEVDFTVASLLDDLEVRLKSAAERGPWFHGEKGPSTIDSVIYGILITALCTRSFPPVTKEIFKRPAMVKYLKSVTEKVFPEYKAVLATLSGGEVVLRTELREE